jgi:hypothetical protein
MVLDIRRGGHIFDQFRKVGLGADGIEPRFFSELLRKGEDIKGDALFEHFAQADENPLVRG